LLLVLLRISIEETAMRRARLVGLGMFGSVSFILAVQAGCSKLPDPWENRPGTRVVASFTPIHCFALNVAGEDANVKTLMTDRGPHHFTSGPRDVRLLEGANLFLINGLQLDNGLAEKMMKGCRNSSLKLVEAAAGIPEKDLHEGGCCDHDADEDHGHDHVHEHEHGRFDPHVWLGIPEAIHMVESIRDELKHVDPDHAAGYESRANAYMEKLNKLAADGRDMLKDKKERKLVAFHDSLFYFARTFNLEIVDNIEITAGAEPGGKKLADLLKQCREHGVRLITVEPQYDRSTSAKTVRENLRANGIAAEFVEIDPLETATAHDVNDPGYYEKVMCQNLKNLAEKLK
jgi:ABC-type Zn uptake system ZnuABC Zn-binding protein ZnuA